MYINPQPTNINFSLKRNLLPFLSGRNFAFFSLGRIALGKLAGHLNIRPGDNVLLPAYICDVAVPPFTSRGVEVRFYGIKADLTPDFEKVRDLLDRRTRAFLIVHYFGFPQPIDAVENFCRENKLFLIEDCAHVFGGKSGDRYLGTFGEAAVFSPWKFLPITGGGILSLSQSYGPVEDGPRGPLIAVKPTIRLCLEELSFRVGSDGFLRKLQSIKRKVKGGAKNPAETEEGSGKNEGITLLDEWLLRRVDCRRLAERRRENYRYLNELLADPRFARPLFGSLPEGAVPLAFPVLVDPACARKLMPLTHKYGFYPWPKLPRFEEPARHPRAVDLSERVFLLPVHQELKRNHLDALAMALKEGSR